MNKLTTTDRAQLLTALVEGNSIASTCRMFGVSKITVLRLLADAGTIAAEFHDRMVRNLPTRRVQVDELWSYCYAKDRNLPEDKKDVFGYGSLWTWTALDADSKLIISYLVGSRDGHYCFKFIKDIRDRVINRIQLTSDGHRAYQESVENAFCLEVDFAQLVKVYAQERTGEARYSPASCIGAEKHPRCGNPDPVFISTSFVERQNLTVRMGTRRFTRLTNGFSKNVENHKYAVALHYFHYNFVRRHMTINATPAVMAGITTHEWTMEDFVRMMESEEKLRGGRITNYKPAASKRLAS